MYCLRGFFVGASLIVLPVTGRADISRWDNGQLIPGTEGITPGPGVMLDAFPLEFAQLSNLNLSEASFHGANLSGADLSGANLTNARLYGAALTDANLTGTNLAGATLAFAQLTDAVFEGAHMAGALFAAPTAGGFTKEQLYSTASYQAKDLRGIVMWGARTYFSIPNGGDLRGWDFRGQNLSGAGFGEVTLANANFNGANLTDASFYGATLTNADLTGAVVKRTHFGADGFTRDQLYSTASYHAKDLEGIVLWGQGLAGWDLSGQNLANAHLGLNGLAKTDLTFADIRGAQSDLFPAAFNASIASRNVILPDGKVLGLAMSAGDRLFVRDHDGVPDPSPKWWLQPRLPTPISIQDRLTMPESSILQLLFDADPWDSLISFEAGIPVQLGGALELTFSDGVDVAAQVGRTLRIFDWTGVSPSGQFDVSSSYVWDVANLYTTGEVTLIAVLEPSTVLSALVGVLAISAVGRIDCLRFGRIGLFACCLLILAANEGRAQLITGKVPVGNRGHELYYEVQGSGEPIVLIHGLTLDLREWDAQAEALAESYQVIRYDVVGHGKSSGLSSTLPNGSVRDWDYLRELLDALDVDKAHVVGLSMGGGMAINFALQYPDRVQTLTPMDARLGGYNVPSELGDRFGTYINVSSSQGVQAALPLWAEDPLFAPANANPEVRMKLEEIVIQGHGALGAGATFQWPNLQKIADLNPSAMSRLHEIDIPTLVMIGELNLIDFQLQANIIDRDIPNSTKLVVPGAGHMSDMEQPAFVNAALLDFFADHPITLPLVGDFNGDSVVDAADLKQWQDVFALNADSDADNDGDSDGTDFLAWQRQLGGEVAATNSTSAVPEPTTLHLLVLAATALHLRRWRHGNRRRR